MTGGPAADKAADQTTSTPDADPAPTCQHPRHLLMIWFWLGWNPNRDGGRWETCDIPRPITADNDPPQTRPQTGQPAGTTAPCRRGPHPHPPLSGWVRPA